MNQETVTARVGAGRIVWESRRDILIPLLMREAVPRNGADPLDGVVNVVVPQPDVVVAAACGHPARYQDSIGPDTIFHPARRA